MSKSNSLLLTTIYLVGITFSCAKPTVAVTGVTLSPETIELMVGDQKVLSATVFPDNATNKTVSFRSSKESVAIVSQEGILEAVAAGEAIVTVTTGDGWHKAYCTVKVTEIKEIVTGAATQVTCRNAELAGKANLQSPAPKELSLGILYSTSPDVLTGSAIKIEADFYDSECNYSVSTNLLEPETTYYYRAYISRISGIDYGTIKSFKTPAVSNMIRTMAATDINPKDAVLNATLDLGDCIYDEVEYYFEVTPEGGSTHTLESDNYSKKEKKFSVKDESLLQNCNYSVVACVKLDDRTYKADALNFTTLPIQATVTAESSNIQRNAGTISGKLTVNSRGSFNKSAKLYYSNTARTVAELKSVGKSKDIPLQPDGTYSLPASGIYPETKHYYCVVASVDEVEFFSAVGDFTTLAYPVPELIDLGLSVKWASCNLGASEPVGTGDFCQWAGTADVSYTDTYIGWDNCPYHNGSDGKKEWMKYNTKSLYGTVDNILILEETDDVAHAILGGNWRMPTYKEWEELRQYCAEVEWVTIDGVVCKKLTSSKNGNSIILPATGYRDGNAVREVGSRGYYWSSTLNANDPSKACAVHVEKDYVVLSNDNFRYRGFSIRPVSK